MNKRCRESTHPSHRAYASANSEIVEEQRIGLFGEVGCSIALVSAVLILGEGTRRRFLSTLVLGAAPLLAKENSEKNETVFRFKTSECNGRLSVRFFDRISEAAFGFEDRLSGRQFCLSGTGQENRNCLSGFTGSIAVALYHFESPILGSRNWKLRESVRSIDHDDRVVARPPYERTLAAERGVISDIQAFGYETPTAPLRDSAGKAIDVWFLMRQDVYFEGEAIPFLTIHWKHSLSAIRLFDVIAGHDTQLIATTGKAR